MFYLGNSTQVGISVLSVIGTGPGAGWMPNKYLFEGGRERGRQVREMPGLWFRRGETRRNKVGWRGSRGGDALCATVLWWALGGPWGLYFTLETEATERFMHEVISSDLPLEVADASGQQTGRGRGWRVPGPLTWGWGTGRADLGLGWGGAVAGLTQAAWEDSG